MKKFLRSLWFLSRVRVRYLAIVLVGVAPLTLLTISTWWKWATDDRTFAPPSNELLLAQAEETANWGQHHSKLMKPMLDHCQELVTGLWTTALGNPPPPPKLPEPAPKPKDAPAEDPALVKSREAARAAQKAEWNKLVEERRKLDARSQALSCVRTVVVEVQALAGNPETIPTESLRRVRGDLTRLQDTLKNARASGVTDLDGIEAAVDKRLKLVEAQLCLAEAQEAFESQNYAGCLDRLSAYPWPKSANPAHTVYAKAEQLRKRADFRQRGTKLLSDAARLLKTKPTAAWQRTVGEFKLFFEEHVAAPHADDEQVHSELKEKGEGVAGNYELATAEWSAMPNLRERVQKLRQIVQEHPKAQLNGEAREQLRGWLEAGVPDKPSPQVDPDLQQAVGKNGAIYIGIFELSGDYYKYWKTAADKRANPSGYRTVVPDSLVQQPGPLTPVVVTGSYTTLRQSLLREVRSRQAWDTFASSCAALQAKLDEFVRGGGGDSHGVSFQDALRHARDVLSIWTENIQPLLSP